MSWQSHGEECISGHQGRDNKRALWGSGGKLTQRRKAVQKKTEWQGKRRKKQKRLDLVL